MEAKHTPGPWVIGSVYREDFGQYAQIHADEQFGDIVARVCVSHKANHTLNECGQANARLIAAAPELLIAAQSLVAWTGAAEMYPDNRRKAFLDDVEQARAAIAKATGA